MQSRDWRSKLAGGAVLAALLVVAGGAYAAEPRALPRRDSVPKLLRTIEFGDYGSAVVRFGDLNGDGQIEALVAQEDASGGQNQIIVSCLTAIDLEGYYVKHIDCYSDEREEILVYDENRLCIYTNAAFREKVEWYNDNIYNGRK